MPASSVLRVLNRTRSTSLGDRVRLADTALTRLVGLLGRRGLTPGEGLLISPSNGVHTLGMLFAIDVLLVDKQRKVVAAYDTLRPFRITRLNWKANSALELPAGTIHATSTAVGDELVIESA